jgi:hypothetical protein
MRILSFPLELFVRLVNPGKYVAISDRNVALITVLAPENRDRGWFGSLSLKKEGFL